MPNQQHIFLRKVRYTSLMRGATLFLVVLSVFGTPKRLVLAAGVSFSTANIYGGPIALNAVAVADFNGDGKPDLALAYVVNTKLVQVLLNATSNRSNLAFSNPMSYSVDSASSAIAVGDFNGDGKPDIVTANSSQTVNVLLNTTSAGTLGFASAVKYATNGSPSSVAVGDFDGNGKLDRLNRRFKELRVKRARKPAKPCHAGEHCAQIQRIRDKSATAPVKCPDEAEATNAARTKSLPSC